MKAEEVISKLALEPLEREGGWFRRIYTGADNMDGRPLATTIYALFTACQFSTLHRLDADEQFFFLGGDPFDVFEISPQGTGQWRRMGPDIASGQTPHALFSQGVWFGGMPAQDGTCGWSLISAVVAPGFLWSGFELGDSATLLAMYPQHADAIRMLTR